MVHGFLQMSGLVDQAQVAIEDIARTVRFVRASSLRHNADSG